MRDLEKRFFYWKYQRRVGRLFESYSVWYNESGRHFKLCFEKQETFRSIWINRPVFNNRTRKIGSKNLHKFCAENTKGAMNIYCNVILAARIIANIVLIVFHQPRFKSANHYCLEEFRYVHLMTPLEEIMKWIWLCYKFNQIIAKYFCSKRYNHFQFLLPANTWSSKNRFELKQILNMKYALNHNAILHFSVQIWVYWVEETLEMA